MSWVVIDSNICTGCEACVTICGRGCFTMANEVAEARVDNTNCNLCGHCVAICPVGAIHHNRMNMVEFEDLENADEITTERFVKFLKKRRSHRHFQDRELPLDLLIELVDTCRYAPTGSNAQTVEVLVIIDRHKIRRLSELTVDYFQQIISRVEKEVAELETSGREIPSELSRTRRRVPMMRRHVTTWEAGRDPILRDAPAVLIFHSTPDSSTPKDDCVIAAHTVTLTAMTMGLETCYIGLIEKSAQESPAVLEAMNLPPGNKVYSVLIAGHPKFQFVRTIARKPIRVTQG